MIPKEKATEVLEQIIEIAKNYKEPGIPKEKAYQLWNKYAEANILTVGKYSNYRGLTTDHARVCALIAVDEIIIELEYHQRHPETKDMMMKIRISQAFQYWKAVKKEIELL